ncbi:MAG: STAS domain-containing protein, partial [Mycobacterium sp.]
MSKDFAGTSAVTQAAGISSEGLLPQLVQHLRRNRTDLREEWARRITEAELLTAMSPEEIFSE